MDIWHTWKFLPNVTFIDFYFYFNTVKINGSFDVILCVLDHLSVVRRKTWVGIEFSLNWIFFFFHVFLNGLKLFECSWCPLSHSNSLMLCSFYITSRFLRPSSWKAGSPSKSKWCSLQRQITSSSSSLNACDLCRSIRWRDSVIGLGCCWSFLLYTKYTQSTSGRHAPPRALSSLSQNMELNWHYINHINFAMVVIWRGVGYVGQWLWNLFYCMCL